MSDLIKVADEINEWAKWCHDNNVKAEVQRTMYKTADEIERLRAELDNERARGIHSCGPHCQRMECVQQRRIAELESAREHWFCENCGCGNCLDAEEAAEALKEG